jgi:succinate dehydrogenase / fumarate reductase flavoprotein subunit
VVSRAIYPEIREGRGVDGKNYVYLDTRPESVMKYAAQDGRTNADGSPYRITAEELLKKLPDIVDFNRVYLGIDPMTEMMPIQPTAHYTMGGIPTNKYGEVVIDDKNTVLPGLYAAGECACVSVHGANRLGTNSLLDLIVFGKHSGMRAAEYAQQTEFEKLPDDPEAEARRQFQALRGGAGTENAFDIANELKNVMFEDVGIYRSEKGMRDAIGKLAQLRERFQRVGIADTGSIFNTELLNAWELGNMLEIAEVIAECALNRQESRGGHSREDFPTRDDQNWLKHTLAWRRDGKVQLGYKPVVITKYAPKERVY